MENIIGRHAEMAKLQQCLDSDRSEFIVVYGRRRIGKTFLVKSFFKDKFDFYFTGNHNMNRLQQLDEFAKTLQQYARSPFKPELNNWIGAFDELRKLIDKNKQHRKKVIFIDEMPWIDSHKSDFMVALESFWNSWASLRDDIVFIACGSATSWIVDKILHNQGGLFNRTTQRIYVRPFHLCEVEAYLKERKFGWNRFTIAQCYMILGGVPFYLSLLNPDKTLDANIDELFFSGSNAPLKVEYNELYSTLFRHPENQITIIHLLAEKREGFTRQEISEKTKIKGTGLTKALEDLEQCDFIFSYAKFGNKTNNAIYRIKDFYTLFFYKYIEGQDTKDKQRWTHLATSQKISSWQGFSFELLCLLHLDEMKKALHCDMMLNDASAWRYQDENQKAQIDLVIKRIDRNINLCEMKFTDSIFAIDKAYENHLLERMSLFKAVTKTRLNLRITMVTTFGVMKNKHSGIVKDNVVLDDLFEETEETRNK